MKIDQSKQISTFIAPGKISSNEIIETIESFDKKKLSNNVLWNFRYANLKLTFSNELENIANRFFRSNWEFQNIRKTAIVASADLWFSIAKMYVKFSKIRDLSNRIQIFRFMDKAIKWLDSEN